MSEATTTDKVQGHLFGPPQPLPEAVPAALDASEDPRPILDDVPLLSALPLRHGARGTLTSRPIGMPLRLWHYWLRYIERRPGASLDSTELLAGFLATNREQALTSRRHRLASATDEVQPTWVTLRPWKDLTAAEEKEWRRRIRMGQTDGTYRVGLRGLQKLERRRNEH